MTTLKFSCEKPGLLVSVRNAAEALTALAGGADVIDVKEPSRGSLGPAGADTISAVVRAVDGRAPVTAALGELVDLIGTGFKTGANCHPERSEGSRVLAGQILRCAQNDNNFVIKGFETTSSAQNGDGLQALPGRVSLFKIGLAGCAPLADWQQHWQHAIDSIRSSTSNADAQPVAVAYADWRFAQSPPPLDVLSAAVERRCPALLIDTWSKSAGSLFDHWPMEDLRNFLAAARSQNLAVVLAGSLSGQSITAAAQLAPDLIAVRTAACIAGRGGTVSVERVRDLKQAIAAATRKAVPIWEDSKSF